MTEPGLQPDSESQYLTKFRKNHKEEVDWFVEQERTKVVWVQMHSEYDSHHVVQVSRVEIPLPERASDAYRTGKFAQHDQWCCTVEDWVVLSRPFSNE